MTINSFPIQTRRVNIQQILDAETYAGDAEAARDTAGQHKDSAAASAAAAASTASGLAGFDLDAIAETKAVTAVDVFVYDTSQDSDGGAWRHRCQHTSWYNETLNTATRGGRREFPAVAVIVAEAAKVTIYDGDDPALPMWMVFNRGSLNMLQGSFHMKAVFAINGQLEVARYVSAISFVNFVSDTGGQRSTSGVRQYRGNVAEANDGLNFGPNDSFGAIVNNIVNDVAMTVLPDAPIDPATGLPVPTIAVATEGGVSVIKDDGAVVDSQSSQTIEYVHLLDNYLYWGLAFTSALLRRTSIVGLSDNFSYISLPASTYSIRGMRHISGHENIHLGGNSGINDGVAILRPSDSYGDTMLSHTTSTYTTGWMPGDIKGAFLSDTDDTDLVESGELVTNGTFDTDLTGWTQYDAARGGMAFENGTLRLDNDGTGNNPAQQVLEGLTIGQDYVLTADILASAGTTPQIRLGNTSGASQVGILDGGLNGTGSFQLTFRPQTTSLYVQPFILGGTGSGVYATFDNISVKLADADRSVNDNGLIVNGTITREPVATGADLVAYSGFSATNYLEQPYNPDLDFGTGDFCVMGWVKTSLATGSTQCILQRGDAGSGGNTIKVELTNTGVVSCLLSGSTVSGGDISSGQFSHVCFTKRSGTLYLHVNGDEISTLEAVGKDATNTDALVRIGQSLSGGRSLLDGSLALWRISATAPTPEQIKRIYEDEKVLFQENAACTLYGASDAVTAISHDPVTDLLHVGTSDGRSVFQGLRRVENTTDAVTAAISANNGMVVDQ